MTNPTPARRPRRWWKALLAASVLALVGTIGLPWLVGSDPGRSRVADRINRALAPGRLEFRSLRVSWFGPTRLGDFTLFDPKGVKVASGPSGSLDRTLGQWILGAPGTITLTLDAATFDIERSDDGSINLVQALRSVIASPDPKRDLVVKVVGGSLRYRDPFLAEPSTADELELDLRVRPAPDPLSWKLRIARGDSALEVHGDYDHYLSRGGPTKAAELQVSVLGKRWPIVARTAGVDASGRLDGSLDFLRRRGQWKLTGDARLLGFQARGGPLNGDSLAFDRLGADWDLAEGDEGWSIRRLALTSPVGDLKAEGHLSGTSGHHKQRIEGRVDLAALARRLPHALHLRDGLTVDRGTARLSVDVESVGSHATFDVEARVADLAARDRDRALSLRDPATFTAHVLRDGEVWSLERLAVKTAFLEASASGRIADGVALEARINLDDLRRQLGDWVELGRVELAGSAKVSGTYRFRPAGSAKNAAEKHADSQVEASRRPTDPTIPSPVYQNDLKASFRDLRVPGVAAWFLPGNQEWLSVTVDGPAEASGWPRGWDRVDAWIGLDTARVRAQLQSKGRSIGMALDTSDRWPTATNPEQYASASLAGDWTPEGRVLTIDRLNLDVIRPVGKRPDSRLQAVARGRLDLSSGELVLDAAPGNPVAGTAPRPDRILDSGLEVLGAAPAVSPGQIVLGPDGIRVYGIGKGLPALRAEGSLVGNSADLDALLAEVGGRQALGLSGRWSALATARGDADGVQVAGKLGLDEAPGPGPKPARPTAMAVRAHYASAGDRIDLSEFTVSTAFGTLDASGRLDDPSGRRMIDLKGTLAPDFGAITARLADRVEPGAKVEGRPRAFRASGSLAGESSGDRFRGLDAEVGFDLTEADVYGMRFGPSPVVLRAKDGRLSFDPISTTLNEGHVRLEPEIDLGAPGGPVLRLAKNSAIREAEINDEVSRRVLAYVAPILDQATRARGLVSVDLDHAEFPIGPGRARQVKLEGAVVFEDVEFAPGPLANDLLGAIGRRDASLKLDRPVTLTIAEGRVNQRGLAVPIGDLTRIELAGWVDFDRNLALTATVPVTPAMLGNNPLLSDIAAGTQVRLPIGGTLDRPRIDQDAFTANLQDLGKSLLTRGATRGAMELLMRLGRPRDPDAPPPPPRMTPQERRNLRQEKKATRRGEIPPPPPGNSGR